ncbi:MAG: hypothetical protein WKF77_06805 [Planctomycetaceae bacterium]
MSCLQGSMDVGTREPDRAAQVSTATADAHQVNLPPKNEPIRMRRGILSGTICGLVAALLIGMAIGNGLPAFWPRFDGSAADRSSNPEDGTVLSAHDVDSEDPAADSEFPDRHPMRPDLSLHLRDALQKRTTAGSQFVESRYLSAIAGASLWERQNGEKFNVTTHVSDRRFDMCRDCHRVGG